MNQYNINCKGEQILIEKFNKEIELGNEYLSSNGKSMGYFFVKRLMDIFGALCGIILFSPVIIITVLAIKLDSRGSVFFTHKRLGKCGRLIKVYKFRTMIPNSEQLLMNLTPDQKKEFQENFKIKNDPRVTKLGDFLRRSSIDELPQLLNVLIGNMSIVGPRPIVEKELMKYGVYGDKLLSVKPGMTGLWQVRGRSDTTYEERVKLDIEYIDKRNFWYDLRIIFKTVVVVVKKKGAR